MLEIYNINSRIFYIKYCLLAFTILFALTGLTLIIIGSTINAVFNDFSYFFENRYFAPAIFLYSIGFLVFGISVVGLIGALKENPCIITFYGVLLGVIFVLQIAIAISTSTILVKCAIFDQLKEKLTYLISKYEENEQYKYHVDTLQEGVGCCGVLSQLDWSQHKEIPLSCCAKLVNGECLVNYRTGCFQVLEYIVDDIGNVLASSAYILALMQLAGACFSLYMGRALRRQKAAKECRRWMLTTQLLNPIEKVEKEDLNVVKQ